MMVVSDVQQQLGVSPSPWQVWGSLGARGVPNPLGRSGMLMSLDPASSAAQGCIPTDCGIIPNPNAGGKGES